MTRALTLTCLALVVLGAPAWAGKPSIAVLGLEVVDQTGTPTEADTKVARELTEGLRGRAKLGAGPYAYASNSEKELIDEKLLNNCDSEAASCMSAIASGLGADMLMFGHLEKEKSGKAYLVTLKLLDVRRKTVEKSSSQLIPLSQASGPSLQSWARQLYANLTGQQSAGMLVVKLTNADRGTILIDGEDKGNITNGVGQVSGLEEGHYKLAIESQGFKRYEQDITIRNGETENVPVKLAKTEGEVVTGVEPVPGGGSVEPGPTRGSPSWRKVFYASLAVGLAGGGVWIAGNNTISDVTNNLCRIGGYQNMDPKKPGYTTDAACVASTKYYADPSTITKENDRGDRGRLMTQIGAGAVIVGGGLALVALYEGFIAKHGGYPDEHAERGHHVHRSRFVVTPIVEPGGGGATLQLSW